MGLGDVLVVHVAGEQTVAGAVLPRATFSSTPASQSNEARNDAQCSRSAASRIFSPNRAIRSPRAPAHSASSHDSRSCTARGSNHGSDVAMSR